MSGIQSLILLTTLISVVPVLSSDVNWGKKVSCFVVEGTVVCPGCNYRAGLSCPRKLKNSENCLISSTKSSLPTEQTSPPETTDEINSTEVNKKIDSTEKIFDHDITTPQTNEIQKESTKVALDMNIYLYRLLGSRMEHYPEYRYKRELEQMEEEAPEVCNWNGDCPCPLICCKTGPGCPKRCVMGIRLPPPWG